MGTQRQTQALWAWRQSPLPVSPGSPVAPESPMGLETESDKATSIRAPFKTLIQRGLGEVGVFSPKARQKSRWLSALERFKPSF